MARKSAALKAIREVVSLDAMKQASGGTSVLPAAMPTLSGKWNPALVEALPEATVDVAPPPVFDLQETLSVAFEPGTQGATAILSSGSEHAEAQDGAGGGDLHVASESAVESGEATGGPKTTYTLFGVLNYVQPTGNSGDDGSKYVPIVHSPIIDVPLNMGLNVLTGASDAVVAGLKFADNFAKSIFRGW